jgi:hypothetical protein
MVAHAANLSPEEIKNKLSKRYRNPPVQIAQTPFSGYYKIKWNEKDQTGYDLIAADGSVMYEIVDQPHDFLNINTMTGLTASQTDAARADLLRNLASQSGFLPKFTFGNGAKKLWVYTAIDCPHCIKLHQFLMDNAASLNATVYYIPTTLNTGGNYDKWLSGLWCGADKENAFNKAFGKDRIPPKPVPECGITRNDGYAISKFLTFNKGQWKKGTPTIYDETGREARGSSSDYNAYHLSIFR